MNLSDQFTSIQLERDEEEDHKYPPHDPIEEETSDVASNHASETNFNVNDQADEDDLLLPQASLQEPKLDAGHETTNDLPPPKYEPVEAVTEYKEDTAKEEPEDPAPVVISPTPSPEVTAPAPESIPVPDYSRYADKFKIETSVQEPIKDIDAQSKPFMNYVIQTSTNNPLVLKLNGYEGPSEDSDDTPKEVTLSTKRRYGDFRYLHDSLAKDYPTVMIPPLPSKSNLKYLTGDTFSMSFIHKRLHSLNTFVKFITSHKRLSQSSVFHLFISDLGDWVTFTKSLKLKDVDDGSGFGHEELTDTFMNFLTPSKYKQETNREVLEINEKLKRLYENLIRLDRLFSKLNKKNGDLSHDYRQFSKLVSRLSQAASQPTTESPGETVPDSALVTNYQVFAEALEYFADSWNSMHKYMDEDFLVSLKNCAKYIISLTNLISLQHNKCIDLQVLQDYHQKAQTELNQLTGGTSTQGSAYHNQGIVGNTAQLIKDTLSTQASGSIGSTATDSKIAKVQNRINQLQEEIDDQTKVVNELVSNIINEEYPNWDKFNRGELKSVMVNYADQQIAFYSGLVDNWNDAESKLLKRLDELK